MPDDNTQTTTDNNFIVPPLPQVDPVSDTATTSDTPVSDNVVAPAPDSAAAPASDSVVAPEAPSEESTPSVISDVANKIAESHNILIALSSDPSVDEMAAAIGLSLHLDRLGKRATAIYSGSTPNALEFLKPEETFETSADTLQDFVIALNKDKADHLRYKLDGDFVKIFVTPYKTRISEEDLEFSYGDFNVDLVLALDVANGIDLDTALREHGRIMHDAVVINITTGNPGKLGEIEWSDKSSSSVSEMVARLLYGMGKEPIEKEEATAFLTGIVAATDRFSSASTTPDTMKIASRLMESGANQQLISKNITPEIENELFSFASGVSEKTDKDPTKLDIEHGNEEGVDEDKIVDATVTEKESTLLNDLKAAEASLATAAAETTPEATKAPLRIEGEEGTEEKTENAPATSEPVLPEVSPASEPSEESFSSNAAEKVIAPSADFAAEPLESGENKYSQMLEDALAEDGGNSAIPTGPIVTAPEPVAQPSAPEPIVPTPEPVIPAPELKPTDNPAASIAPTVPSAPEVNGIPEINYMPLPGDEVLPPPPTPPVDFGSTDMPAAPAPAPEVPSPASIGGQPAMQDQVYSEQANKPDAFKIPGM